MRFGPKQSLEPLIRKIEEICATHPMGVDVDVIPAEPEYTREEEKGFHWLLEQWMLRDRRITIDAETLKEHVCRTMWGVIREVGPGGQEFLRAAKRTTREWDHDNRKYRRKKLTREQYAALIDHVYRMAADDGVVLPELEKEA